MRFKVLVPTAFTILACLFYLSLKDTSKNSEGPTKGNDSQLNPDKQSATQDNAATNSAASDTATPRRFPAALSFDGLLSKYISPDILQQVEVQVLDSGDGFMRLGLFKNKIAIENADFHFSQSANGQWELKDGEWIFGELRFAPQREGLSETKAQELLSSKFPSDATDVSIQKISEFWRVRDNEAKQYEVWRAEYRSKNEGLRRELYIVDVATQSIQRKNNALRH